MTERDLDERAVVKARRSRHGPAQPRRRRDRQRRQEVSATPRTTVRKEKIGRVVSDKMDKTIVVSVERLRATRSTSASSG